MVKMTTKEGLRLQKRVGHRLVSTIENIDKDICDAFETIVFGGRNREKIAFMETYNTAEEAVRGHLRVLDDLRANPEKYRLGNLY